MGDSTKTFNMFCHLAMTNEKDHLIYVISTASGADDTFFDTLVRRTSDRVLDTKSMQYVWLGYLGNIAIFNSKAISENEDVVSNFVSRVQRQGVPTQLLQLLRGETMNSKPTLQICDTCTMKVPVSESQRICSHCQKRVCDSCCAAQALKDVHNDNVRIMEDAPMASSTVLNACICCPACQQIGLVYPLNIECGPPKPVDPTCIP